MSSKLRNIPLDQLVSWKGNVRKTGRKEGLSELCASIAAHGVLQPLVVRKQDDGIYAVIAGERRHLACQILAKKGQIASDSPIPCCERTTDDDLTEISLAENVMRVAMHPADQFEAFAKLVAEGAKPEDIAQRFGVTEDTVAKRLKLGRLSPKILRAYRAGDIGLEQAQAFALSDDRKAQERVFENLPQYSRSPATIRRALTEGEVPSSDKRVRFVGLQAVQEAGGTVRRDLFDAEDSGYVQDAELLDRLVAEKLEAQAAKLRAEGWSWVAIIPDLSYDDTARCDPLQPGRASLPKKKRAQLRKLQQQHDNIAAKLENDSDDDTKLQEALAKVEARINALEALTVKWSAKQLAAAGAIVSLDYDGTIDIRRGLVRPEDKRKAKASAKASPGAAAENAADMPIYPAALTADLSAHKTAAIGIELTRRPDIALASIVHALALDVLYGTSVTSCVKISGTRTAIDTQLAQPEECAPLQALGAVRDSWGDHLPGDPADLWSWCLKQSQDNLLELLGVIAGHCVDSLIRKGDQPASTRLDHAQALATALGIDMTQWYTPTAENYFGRVSKAQIIEAYRQAKSTDIAPAWHKLKKPELADRVATAVATTGWLPAPVRIGLPANDTAYSPDAVHEAAE